MTAQTSGQTAARRPTIATDRRLVLICGGVLLVLILLYSLFAPRRDRSDPNPTIDNTGSQGARAAFLLLPQLGYRVDRLDAPLTLFHPADPAHATLILTEPVLPVQSLKATQAAVAEFVRRGGRVLATGSTGAELLPGSDVRSRTASATHVLEALCYTTPEGEGALARAGKVTTEEPVRWADETTDVHVEQRCGQDAAVIRYRFGQGETIWWSAPYPLTNAGLTQDPDLHLLLASIGGPGRVVVFDEYMHQTHESLDDTVRGLPLQALLWQLAAVGMLLVLSRGRRNGPLRLPVTVPRTSPVEFAESMGRLYGRARATQAPLEAARARQLEFLAERCGLSPEMLRTHPEEAGHALGARFGGDWQQVGEHLEQALSQVGGEPLNPKSALKLVQALERDRHALEARLG